LSENVWLNFRLQENTMSVLAGQSRPASAHRRNTCNEHHVVDLIRCMWRYYGYGEHLFSSYNFQSRMASRRVALKRVSTTTRLCCTPTAKRDWVLKRIAEGRFGSEDLWCLSITLPRDATGFPAMASTGLWPTTRRAISFLSWRSLYNILKIVWNLPTRSIDCFQGDGNAALRLISERAFRLSQIILKLCSRFRSSERRPRCDFSRVASS